MKIILNAVALVPGRRGGEESYFRNLISSMQAVDIENDYLLLCHDDHFASFSLTNRKFTHLHCSFSKPSPFWYLRAAIRHSTPFDPLRPYINRLDADLIHHPFSILQPIGHRVPSVLTFHDMQHEFRPEFFSPYALKARRALYRPSVNIATRIIAISKHVKQSLVERYEVPPEKIDVIYNGFDPQYRPIDDPVLLQTIRERHGLHRPFIYYPAATWPHKNHKRLLVALKVMKERYRFDGQLVLSGIAKQANDEVLAEIGRLGLRDDVVVVGYLPYEDLPCLYNLARLMVFPSLFEGFGIPLVEAMACGLPVACSNVTSLPEVAGDAAAFFDPTSVEEIAETSWKLWSDHSLREALKRKGLERVRRFGWETMARQTLEVYEKTVKSS